MGLFILLACAFMGTVQAQDASVSDADLEKFANAYKAMLVINQDAQQRMISAVEAEKLSVERFNEIAMAHEDPDQAPEASEAEMKLYDAALTSLMKVQREVQEEMESLIVKSGLSVERYQEIALQLQADPELQMRIQMMLQG